VRVHDLLGGQELTTSARAVLCAAGPWTDEVLATTGGGAPRWLRPTKGVHIVVPRERLAVESAVVLQHPADRRVLFALPFHERTVLGTTDTDFDGDPGQVRTTDEDVRYLLEAARHYFPSAHLRADDVIATWAGVRPLIASDSDDPSAVSREERIEALQDGVVAVAGGKLTTYRRIAAACLDAVAPAIMEAGGPLPRRPAPEEKGPLPGAVGLETEEKLERLRGELIRRVGDREVARQLSHSYGVRAREVLELVERRPTLAERIVPELPLVWAQVVFAARAELALTLADVMIRRTQLCYRDRRQGLDAVERASELLAEELGWDAAERARQIQDYREQIARSGPAGEQPPERAAAV
jgi:glycerol-3-phosphate dehydrogenase